MEESLSQKEFRMYKYIHQIPSLVFEAPPPTYISPQAPTTNPVMQLIKWFSVSTNSLIIDQQPNVDIFQQPNFYSEQNDSPSQTQLLQDNLMEATKMESKIFCQMNEQRILTVNKDI